MKKIWIYIIAGISFIAIGIFIWGMLTNWKFVPKNTNNKPSNSSSSSSGDTKCGDQNCNNGQICMKNDKWGDGTKSKCCNPDQELDAQGDMCCSKDNIDQTTGQCCVNGKKGKWSNKTNKSCCNYVDKKGNCYTPCGSTPCTNDNQDS